VRTEGGAVRKKSDHTTLLMDVFHNFKVKNLYDGGRNTSYLRNRGGY
jgi:hypothetical protein